MHKIIKLLLTFWITFLSFYDVQAQFAIVAEGRVASIVYDIENSALDSIVAHLLAKDIEAITGKQPKVHTHLEDVEGNVIIIADSKSPLVAEAIDVSTFADQWEMYGRVFGDAPAPGIDQAMYIVGSDPRGAAYGVFDLSKEIGISPWYWWADAPIEHKEALLVNAEDSFSNSPSVKFRGIFINDEGWGLEPWASKTFEPSVGNMGPKTYGKIYELLLRLKGNAIWPGMHPNTRAFFTVPGNAETAELWEMVVGTSHAEPMLRNNVGEWDSKTMGRFNYRSNAASVYRYWEERVKESAGMDAIYSVGMRGVHDSGMEGFGSLEEKVEGLERVISDQRKLLGKYINEEVTKVPQSFAAYKEVLEIYENGLELPDDITIMWPDDNHGYLKRFSTAAEQQRSGGAGFYYHLSYLGAPHPYIWLSPMSPALVWRELTRASLQQMNQIWIANVGGLKRREWGMEFFMDLAWNTDTWNPDNIHRFFEQVASRDIAEKHSKEIADLMWEYHRLATERKPEFMGFNKSQWNGWTPIRDPSWSLWDDGDEVEKRIHRYQELRSKAQKIMAEIPQAAKDTYFQLVYYPIAGAAAMNEKWLYAFKSREYAKQGRAVANAFSDSAFAAHAEISQLTAYYNQEVANGKWEHVVDKSPSYKKGSLVFWEPITERVATEEKRGLGVAIEGQSAPIRPVQGSQPTVTTRGDEITMSVTEAQLSGELVKGTDAEGTYISWPDDGTQRKIEEPYYDVIPYEIGSDTKAEFEFDLGDKPGGVHTLYLSVDHPDTDSDSWWVTLNDKPPYRSEEAVGRNKKLKAHDFVLKPGVNKLTIHPGEDGAKLYGVEFVQTSQDMPPRYSNEHYLPNFDRYRDQQYFIDVYSRGETKEAWAADASEPWIILSKEKGELHGGQDRIWVSLNNDEMPSEGALHGHVSITNGHQDYEVALAVNSPQVGFQPGDFVEANGVISMQASDFSRKEAGAQGAFQPLTGLGRSGSAMLLSPMNGWYVEKLSDVPRNSPVLVYDVVVTRGGQGKVRVEAVPGFPLIPSKQLRCAISIGDDSPQWVDFEMGSKSKGQPWIDNVLESRMMGEVEMKLEPGTYQLKLWGTDPSVSIDRITIDFGDAQSYVLP
ncbi:glycosyl hydrolase 115 family protein [Echinicola rosea]|uniref:Gylcosyl hydrolase 115 C-terminal domain-containing protein n=1 Tax=Echinicola rosea TaxID=1807691 RepID=A0ABQ1VBA0_9BACT|nr:glycosyl hydrolase 115 family protein [Echinicola rosea]GGF48065.1 hypothetical protein GCM10011339_40790 [Echinicola rosea]